MIKNIIAYLQGNLRYKLYYSEDFKFLIRDHIQEQIDFRIKIMETLCYDQGSCKKCGCTTTALQMANKECLKPCYPPMFSEEKWEYFKKGGAVEHKGLHWFCIVSPNNRVRIYRDAELVHTKLLKENINLFKL